MATQNQLSKLEETFDSLNDQVEANQQETQEVLARQSEEGRQLQEVLVGQETSIRDRLDQMKALILKSHGERSSQIGSGDGL